MDRVFGAGKFARSEFMLFCRCLVIGLLRMLDCNAREVLGL